MQKPVLTISELRANVEDKEILKGVNLEIKGGEVHAIMGLVSYTHLDVYKRQRQSRCLCEMF